MGLKVRVRNLLNKLKTQKTITVAFFTTVLTELVSIYLSSRVNSKSLGILKYRRKLLLLIKVLQGFLCSLLYYKLIEKFLSALSPLLKKYYLALLNRLQKV
jgi:hypothetical protein